MFEYHANALVVTTSFLALVQFVTFDENFNLVPRVLGLLGQRVSARRDSGIIDSIFPENVGSGLITYA